MSRQPAAGVSAATPPRVSGRLAGVRSSPVRDILSLTERPEVISFAGGLPAPELFPGEMLAEAFAAVTGPTRARRSLQYSPTEGVPELREGLAARLRERGVAGSGEDVLVTTGSQQALSLVATVLLDPGDAVLVEDPAYLAALQAFAFAGARPVPVPCDDDGIDPEALPGLIAAHRPKFLYCVPNFQNPTGRTLGAARRARLAELAAEHDLWIVEDDPYGELRYGGTAVPSIASHPGAAERTVAVSSLSKVLAPGLRIGWLRAPRSLLRPLVIAKQAGDLHTSTVDQLAAAHCLGQADLDAHVARLLGAYRARRDAMLAGLPAALPPGAEFNRPAGGMFLWVRLPEGHDATALLRTALDHDVAFVPGAPFYASTPDPRTLRLSFTTHAPEEIALGLERLATALAAHAAAGGTRG
jgi:DNA-binding transcriptional MocR family regulator